MDRFDFQRKLDTAAEDVEEELEDEVVAEQDKLAKRNKRLIKLSVGHYYDPVDKCVYSKLGSQYILLKHDRSVIRRQIANVKAEALDNGFRPVSGGLYWNVKLKHLYVKQGDKFVLYALNRRKAAARVKKA